jgi:hypothetical protein
MASAGGRLAARTGTYNQDSGVVGQQLAKQRVNETREVLWHGRKSARHSARTLTGIGLAQLPVTI